MSVIALYKALIEAKVSEDTAEKAADSVASADRVAEKSDFTRLAADVKKMATDMATKADIEAAVSKLETRQMRLAIGLTGLLMAWMTILDKFF